MNEIIIGILIGLGIGFVLFCWYMSKLKIF